MNLKQLSYTNVENKEVKKVSYGKSTQLIHKDLANEYTKEELEECVIEQGFTRVKGLESNGVFINEFGVVVKVGTRRTRQYATISKVYNQKHDRTLRVNVVIEGKKTSRNIAKMVYQTFVGELIGDIVYIDGDMENCHVDNLVTTNDLYNIVKEKDLMKEIIAKRK